jgi:hypothetical protein
MTKADMTTVKVDAKQVARFAAQGVAIALAARTETPEFRGPFHIICGIPKEIFEVTLEADAAGGFKVASVQLQRAGG